MLSTVRTPTTRHWSLPTMSFMSAKNEAAGSCVGTTLSLVVAKQASNIPTAATASSAIAR